MHKKGKKCTTFVPVMKRLRYILAVLMSSLVIMGGVGVSVLSYCCSGCQTPHSCCASACSDCAKKQHTPQSDCKDTGCSATHYKIDVVNTAQETLSVPSFHVLYCKPLPLFFASLPREGQERSETLYAPPPPDTGSRHYLALYSVLLM